MMWTAIVCFEAEILYVCTKYMCARFYRLVISARYVKQRRKLAHLLLHLHERRLITLLGKWQRLHRSLAEDTSKASLKAIYVCSLLKISQARVTRVYSPMVSGRFKAGCENLIKFNKLLSTSLHLLRKMDWRAMFPHKLPVWRQHSLVYLDPT